MAELDAQWNRTDLPIMDCVPVTPGNDELANGATKGILLSADDTISVVTYDGNARDLPLAGKVIHRIAVTKVTAATADVFACY